MASAQLIFALACAFSMAAKRIILLATGKGKAKAIAQAIKGNITPRMPASLLQVHPNVQFLLDEDAASEL